MPPRTKIRRGQRNALNAGHNNGSKGRQSTAGKGRQSAAGGGMTKRQRQLFAEKMKVKNKEKIDMNGEDDQWDQRMKAIAMEKKLAKTNAELKNKNENETAEKLSESNPHKFKINDWLKLVDSNNENFYYHRKTKTAIWTIHPDLEALLEIKYGKDIDSYEQIAITAAVKKAEGKRLTSYALGQKYLQSNDIVNALYNFEMALKQGMKTPEIYALIARQHLSKWRKDPTEMNLHSSMEQFTLALAIPENQENNPEILLELAMMYSYAGNTRVALTILGNLISQYQTFWNMSTVIFLAAILLMDNFDYNQALPYIEHVTDDPPEGIPQWLCVVVLIRCQLAMNKLRPAWFAAADGFKKYRWEKFNVAVDTKPSAEAVEWYHSISTWKESADILYEMGYFNIAQKYYEGVLEKENSSDVKTYISIFNCMARVKKWEEGIVMLTEAYEVGMNKWDPVLRDILADNILRYERLFERQNHSAVTIQANWRRILDLPLIEARRKMYNRYMKNVENHDDLIEDYMEMRNLMTLQKCFDGFKLYLEGRHDRKVQAFATIRLGVQIWRARKMRKELAKKAIWLQSVFAQITHRNRETLVKTIFQAIRYYSWESKVTPHLIKIQKCERGRQSRHFVKNWRKAVHNFKDLIYKKKYKMYHAIKYIWVNKKRNSAALIIQTRVRKNIGILDMRNRIRELTDQQIGLVNLTTIFVNRMYFDIWNKYRIYCIHNEKSFVLGRFARVIVTKRLIRRARDIKRTVIKWERLRNLQLLQKTFYGILIYKRSEAAYSIQMGWRMFLLKKAFRIHKWRNKYLSKNFRRSKYEMHGKEMRQIIKLWRVVTLEEKATKYCAATDIQRVHRGGISRERVRDIKYWTRRKRLFRKREVGYFQKAFVVFRKSVTRNKLRAWRSIYIKNRMALKIQCAYRICLAKRLTRFLRQKRRYGKRLCFKTMKTFNHGRLKVGFFQFWSVLIEGRAAEMIQKIYRGYSDKLWCVELREERDKRFAALKRSIELFDLQNQFLGMVRWDKYTVQENCAMTIQRLFRSWLDWRRNARKNHSIAVYIVWFVTKVKRRYRFKWAASIVIQKLFRNRLSFIQMMKRNKRFIDREERMTIVKSRNLYIKTLKRFKVWRKEQRKHRRAVVKIQAEMRRILRTQYVQKVRERTAYCEQAILDQVEKTRLRNLGKGLKEIERIYVHHYVHLSQFVIPVQDPNSDSIIPQKIKINNSNNSNNSSLNNLTVNTTVEETPSTNASQAPSASQTPINNDNSNSFFTKMNEVNDRNKRELERKLEFRKRIEENEKIRLDSVSMRNFARNDQKSDGSTFVFFETFNLIKKSGIMKWNGSGLTTREKSNLLPQAIKLIIDGAGDGQLEEAIEVLSLLHKEKRNIKLKNLMIVNGSLTNQQMTNLLRALEVAQGIETLQFLSTKLEMLSSLQIAKYISKPETISLKELVLENNNFGNAQIAAIACAIPSNSNLKIFRIIANRISLAETGILIGNAMKKHKKIKTLDLSKSRLTDEVLVSFSNTAYQDTKLKSKLCSLILQDNTSLSVKAIDALVSSLILCKVKKLTELDMLNCNVSTNGALLLDRYLKLNKDFKKLQVQQNDIEDPAGFKFIKRIDNSENLEVHLNGNKLSFDFIVNGMLGKGKNITYLEKCIAPDMAITSEDKTFSLPGHLPPIKWDNNNQWGTRPPEAMNEKVRFYDRIRKVWIEL